MKITPLLGRRDSVQRERRHLHKLRRAENCEDAFPRLLQVTRDSDYTKSQWNANYSPIAISENTIRMTKCFETETVTADASLDDKLKTILCLQYLAVNFKFYRIFCRHKLLTKSILSCACHCFVSSKIYLHCKWRLIQSAGSFYVQTFRNPLFLQKSWDLVQWK